MEVVVFTYVTLQNIFATHTDTHNEWATTKQACRDELVVYLCFSSHIIYFALLLCIEHCFTKIEFYTLFIFINIITPKTVHTPTIFGNWYGSYVKMAEPMKTFEFHIQ